MSVHSCFASRYACGSLENIEPNSFPIIQYPRRTIQQCCWSSKEAWSNSKALPVHSPFTPVSSLSASPSKLGRWLLAACVCCKAVECSTSCPQVHSPIWTFPTATQSVFHQLCSYGNMRLRVIIFSVISLGSSQSSTGIKPVLNTQTSKKRRRHRQQSRRRWPRRRPTQLQQGGMSRTVINHNAVQSCRSDESDTEYDSVTDTEYP